MASLRHLFPKATETAEIYTYPGTVKSGDFSTPPRDRKPHAAVLSEHLATALEEAEQRPAPSTEPPRQGTVLTFRGDPGFKLKLESLDFRPSGIELLGARIDESDVMHATVFVPTGKASYFVKRLEQYAHEDTDGDQPRPRHRALVESIAAIKLATLESLWTDAGTFPTEPGKRRWWEIWLRESAVTQNQEDESQRDVVDEFRKRAAFVGIDVPKQQLRFPERRVALAHASIRQLLAIENVFDLLAELRLAKLLPGEFLALTPSEQNEFITELKGRVAPPTAEAPAVCHLDTGVNREHPLLEMAIGEEHVLAVFPDWSADDRNGHGTEMAGLALYGCLTEVFGGHEPVQLSHFVESVKIFRTDSPTNPDLWGDLTIQAASRIEIAAPERSKRAFCLTVTVEGRDDGAPSSWSAAIDQLCFGVDETAGSQLLIVSAGNLPLELRHEYPDRNFVEGVEDPAQSWNALTVGAISKHSSVGQTEYSGWEAVATHGDQLSPASRTSCIWRSKSWPLKPDIVMNGGNVAINPITQRADYVDDLSLLTTRVSPAGALLTTTGDTSASAALASRFAARLWAQYPTLRPETIRGLMVHSARWSEPMRTQGGGKESLLRSFGYGEPHFDLACWSASNSVTLVVESSLQPFEKTPSGVKTKDMHLHRLPWPVSVLQGLLGTEVRMRVTLAYSIEPSPGRRGWTRKHRYQSHGLRFDVKQPTHTDDEFRKRISAAARDEDEQMSSESDDREWAIGKRLRCKGSIHSDVWSGTAAELAASGVIAIFPVTGWWKERAHLKCYVKEANYSLVVTIETDEEEVDLYTPIANEIAVIVTG